MVPSFSFNPDFHKRLMRIRMSGFFMPEDVARFATALMAQFERLGRAFRPHVTLVDIRGMEIQTKESVEAFARVIGDQRYASQRMAIVVEPGLARMQIQRITAQRGAQFFADPTAAETWLIGTASVQRRVG